MKMILLALALLFMNPVAAVQLTPPECRSLAAVTQNTAEIRDLHADKVLHLALLKRKNAGLADESLQLLLRAFEVVYASTLTPEELSDKILQQCYIARGDMGESL